MSSYFNGDEMKSNIKRSVALALVVGVIYMVTVALTEKMGTDASKACGKDHPDCVITDAKTGKTGVVYSDACMNSCGVPLSKKLIDSTLGWSLVTLVSSLVIGMLWMAYMARGRQRGTRVSQAGDY